MRNLLQQYVEFVREQRREEGGWGFAYAIYLTLLFGYMGIVAILCLVALIVWQPIWMGVVIAFAFVCYLLWRVSDPDES